MNPRFILDKDDDVWVLEDPEGAVETNPSYVSGNSDYIQPLQYIQQNYGPVRELVLGNELKKQPKNVGDAVQIVFDGPLNGLVAGVIEYSDGQYCYTVKLEINEAHVK